MDRKYYFLKLIPPRASFTRDMTTEERARMQAHGAYWAPHVAAGTMLVMGPVDDPEGGWGMGVIGVEGQAQLDDLLQADPAAAICHWEIFPMLGIKYKP